MNSNFRTEIRSLRWNFSEIWPKIRKCPEYIIESNETETESVWIVSRISERNSDNNTLLSGFTILMILNPISVISEPRIHCEGFN